MSLLLAVLLVPLALIFGLLGMERVERWVTADQPTRD